MHGSKVYKLMRVLMFAALFAVAPGTAGAWTKPTSTTTKVASAVFGTVNCYVVIRIWEDGSTLLAISNVPGSTHTPTGHNFNGAVPAPTLISNGRPLVAAELSACSYITAVDDLTQKFEDAATYAAMTLMSVYFTAIVADGETVAFNGQSVTGDGTTRFSFEIKISGAANAAPTLSTTFQELVVPATGPTAAEILAAQQNFFTTLIMQNQMSNLIDGVNQNVFSRLNGGGANSVSPNSFFFQSNAYSLQQRAKARDELTAGLLALSANNPDSPQNEASPFGFLDEEAEMQNQWNFWIRGQGTNFDDNGSSFDGYTFDVIAGVDRKLGSNAVFGILTGYGKSDFDTLITGVAGGFAADGFHIGAYGGMLLSETLIFDGLVAYTRSDYDNTSGTTSGSFDANRITVAANLTGSMEFENFTLNPMIGFTYASEGQSAWIDSAANAHASQTVTAGRLSAGPKVTFHPYQLGEAMMQPWLAAKWEYDFSNAGSDPTLGLPDLGDLSSARLSAGFVARLENGTSLSMQVDGSGLGSGAYTAFGGSVGLSVRY